MVFDFGRVDRSRFENGIYQKLFGDSSPDGVEKVPPYDDFEFHFHVPRDERAAVVSAAQIAAKSADALLEMIRGLNWNWNRAHLAPQEASFGSEASLSKNLLLRGISRSTGSLAVFRRLRMSGV